MQVPFVSHVSNFSSGTMKKERFSVILPHGEDLPQMVGHWWTIYVLDIPHSELESTSIKHCGDLKECCWAVPVHWLDNPHPGSPTTWQGLIDLLEDCQLGQAVSELINVLLKLYNSIQSICIKNLIARAHKREINSFNTGWLYWVWLYVTRLLFIH